MGQSGFMIKKRNLPPLLSFSTLLVCILPYCRLRDWCGNLRKASGHVVSRLEQSASFRIFDSTFYFPHSAIPHFTHSRLRVVETVINRKRLAYKANVRSSPFTSGCNHGKRFYIGNYENFRFCDSKIIFSCNPPPNRQCSALQV